MDSSTAAAAHMGALFLILIPIMLIAMVVAIIPYWFIFKKAGFAPLLSLLMMVPLANIIILYVVAFSQWKVVPAPQIQAAQPLPPQPWQPTA